MIRPRRFRLVILLSLVASVLGTVADPRDAHPQVREEGSVSPAPKQILLLYSYGHGGRGVGIFDDGFLSVVGAAGISINDLYFEYLDLGRYGEDREYRLRLRDHLIRKYAGGKIGLIVTVQQPALGFLLGEGERIAPGAPVITAQAPMPTGEEAKGRRFFCQVTQFDIKGTLERALDLFPRTRRVVFVSGNSEADRKMEAAAASVAAAWRGKLEFEYTGKLSLEQMLRRIAGLPPDTVVIFTQYNRDPGGRVLLAYEVEGMITKVANAPVFGLYDFNLGNGGIGGSVVSVKSLGESTGQLALDILGGKIQPTRPVTVVNNKVVPMFDWRQIQRWGGDARKLPRGSVINRPPSTWEQYKGYFLAAILILLVQSSLIAALLFQRRRREKAEESLRETTRRLLLATTSGGIGIWDWDIPSDVLGWDDRMFELYGVSKDTFSNRVEAWEKSLHPEDYAAATEAIQAGIRGEREFDTEFRVLHPDGKVKFLQANGIVIRDADGKPLRMIGMNRDITERRNLEQQLRQSQKIEAVGRLAGGVAHDFNNLLTVITGYSELLLSQLDEKSPQRKEVEEIKRAGERAASLTGQLLAFSRRQVLQPKVLDLNEVVSGMEKMLRRLIPEDVEFRAVLGRGLWSVKADPGQIEQVVMNIVVNARDAMPGGGKLTVETSNITLDENYSYRHLSMQPGPYVMLVVSDTGVGMDEETVSKIFEPFFTTKEKGKGTGLGLATVYGIVKQSGGFLWVYSEPGQGSTFKVYLPRTEDQEEALPKEVPVVEDLRGGKTVLLVEDDESIRKLAVDVLRRYGYTILAAGDGEEALRIARTHEGKISLLLTDVVMPKMGGAELYKQLRQLRPGIKILYMSGYTDNAIVHQGVLDLGVAFLQKPYSPISLARKVKEVLEMQG